MVKYWPSGSSASLKLVPDVAVHPVVVSPAVASISLVPLRSLNAKALPSVSTSARSNLELKSLPL